MTRQNRTLFWISAAIVLLTLISYEPVRKNGFVDFDDGEYVKKNPNVSGGITGQSIVWAFTKFHSGNWHPLTWISHMTDCEIYGLNPQGHHITNVVIHIINSLLLLWLLWKMTGAIWPSAFVAAVFALHPLHVESVAWISERKDVLSTTFWMLTMLAYARYVKKPNFGRYAVIMITFAMGLMSKPMVVTLPFVLILMDYWPTGRFENSKFSILKSLFEKAPLLVMSAISGVVTIFAQHHGGAVIPLDRLPFIYRLANTFISYIRYVGKTLWPGKLAAIYSYNRDDFSAIIITLSILLFILLTALCVYIGRRRKYVLVGWLWFVGTLVPVIGLLQVGSQAIADRYMYVPMIGLLILIAWTIKEFTGNYRKRQIIASILAGIISGALVVFTRIQVGYWQNNYTLFGHTLKVTENNSLAENNYGWALFEKGQVDEAVEHLRKAVSISPTYFDARLSLGKMLVEQGKINEAVLHFNELISINQESQDLYYNLGLAANKQLDYDEAIKCFEKAISMDPKHLGARNGLGTALMSRGKVDKAIEIFNELLQQDANFPEISYNMGVGLGMQGKYEEAIKYFNKALEKDPDIRDARNKMGAALTATGRFDEAIECFVKLIEQKQASAEVYYNLGVALNNKGIYDEAIKSFNKAVNMDPNYSEARKATAAALMASGRIDDAIACLNQILRLDGDSAETYYRLAFAMGMQGKYDHATKYLAKTLELDPNYPDAQHKMGAALTATGKPAEAIDYLNEALRTSDNPEAIYADLGVACYQTGKYEQAMQNWDKAIQLNPNNINTLNNLARLLATTNEPSLRDANKAIEYAQRTCELTGNQEPQALDTLAAAYAASGKFDEAIKTARQAVESAKARGQEDLANEINKRIDLYKAGQPYFEKQVK